MMRIGKGVDGRSRPYEDMRIRKETEREGDRSRVGDDKEASRGRE